ncbi:unnamed protein product [Zymoseptoria tritici ST99CH_3D7]|uniref:Uncharacterized protein n=1 Tax=Zymoseptoria tritici (strain ST99CH_3D7) TaxID=1276538 RepID=A0A1X7RPV3_ZYMT9|nr:unnamed protein product [Zymoseptoria tritici ST99CH_3D7]
MTASRLEREPDDSNGLSFEALYRQRDPRLETLRKLSNPWPEHPSGKQEGVHKGPLLPEATAAIVPHDVFRQMVHEASGPKAMRQALRIQLLRCDTPREIFKVVAVAMRYQYTAENLAVLEEPLIRALYRCRQHASDPEVLNTLNAIISRFRIKGLQVNPMLTFMALKFAARARSLRGMKRHLKMVREEGLTMSSNMFRSIIAKCSIGHRGLGEIRNGRWRRSELFQVLTGFDDCKHLPIEKQYHLGTILIRDDWQYLHGWVAVLARCRDSQGVWNEWVLWKDTPARRKPRMLQVPTGSHKVTTRHRGDHWFVEQATMSGDLAIAWKILQETEIPFHYLKPRTKDRLLDGLEHATVIDEHIRNELMKKHDRDLLNIERATDRSLRDQYGFPYDDDGPIVAETERELHDAAEGGAA